VWERTAFDHFAGSQTQSVVLFKLHGSANWHQQNGKITKGPSVSDPTDPECASVMIYPATRKIAIEEPYFTAYDYLEKCLVSAQLCLVVGYSFRDYDTLMRFKAASLRNRRLKIAVFDPDAVNLCARLKEHGISTAQIPCAFGVDKEEEITAITAIKRLVERKP
jgi:hypothetical protein